MDTTIDPNRPIWLGCIPADYDAQQRMSLEADVPLKPYAGSIPGICKRCGVAVLIGPRQQIVLRDHPNAIAMCLPCASLGASLTGADVHCLGNPEHKR